MNFMQGLARATHIEALFADEVVVVETRTPGTLADLFDAERICMANCSSKRIGEFAAGRNCARAALNLLGYAPEPLLQGPDKIPVWPKGIAGSISHAAGRAMAVVGRTQQCVSLGLDVERVSNVKPELWPLLLCDAELQSLSALSAAQAAITAAIMFSAKEAFYKCQYPVTAQWLEFSDVCIINPATNSAGLITGYRDVPAQRKPQVINQVVFNPVRPEPFDIAQDRPVEGQRALKTSGSTGSPRTEQGTVSRRVDNGVTAEEFSVRVLNPQAAAVLSAHAWRGRYCVEDGFVVTALALR